MEISETINKKAAIIGIAGAAFYFLSVLLFLVTKLEWALTLWEIMTVVGAIIILIVLTEIAEKNKMKGIYRKFLSIALSGTVIITSIAHFTSIGVIRKLAAQGESVPDYFKIGYFPSVEMTLDYIAWGFFMGFSFFILFLGIRNQPLKTISAACSALCFTGFIGSFFLEYLWYPAPFGYGFGFLIMCIFILRQKQSGD